MKLLILASLVLLLGQGPITGNPKLTIARGDANIPPFEFIGDGGVTGIHIKMVNAVAKKIGYDIVWERTEWKRALIKVKAGSADGVTYVSKTKEREEYIIFLRKNILSQTKYHLFTIKEEKVPPKSKKGAFDHKSKNYWKKWFDYSKDKFTKPKRVEESTIGMEMDLNWDLSSLTGYPIAVIKGFSYGDKFDSTSFDEKIYAKTFFDLKNAVVSGRAKIGIVDKARFISSFKKEIFFSRVKFSDYPIHESENYIGFGKDEKLKEVIIKFSDEMDKFKMSREYLDILKEFGLD
ncbi:MAG: transporter substrate-binding domain-containing protein [Deltaproteobacteria bacterium]|nr:MAG: transporter substrate-binding domain-containing protein [Deltaproteobacteria bacterium]